MEMIERIRLMEEPYKQFCCDLIKGETRAKEKKIILREEEEIIDKAEFMPC